MRRVLVVEDDSLVRGLLRRMLTEAGYQAESRENADSALAALDLRVKEWDVVVSDYRLPGISGLSFLEQVRARHPHVRVVLMSAYLTDDVEEQARACGAVGVLRKPFSFSELKTLLRSLEEKSEPQPA